MRRPAALAACILFALAGCGGDARQRAAPAATTTESDRAAIQQRVATYLRSYAAGDGARACAQLTAALRARSDQRAAASDNESCAAVLSALGPEIVRAMPEEEREAFVRTLGDPAAVRVQLQGGRALATLEGRTANRLALVRENGRWLIDGLGVPVG